MQNAHDELVPDPQVQHEFGVTSMTLWRWDNDRSLGFPPKIKIRSRNYRSRAALDEFRGRMIREAIAKKSAGTEVPQDAA